MSERSAFSKPISAAFGKATGVFSRPKLQRRAYTAHAASELIAASRLPNVLVSDFKETKHHEQTDENNNDLIAFSPCLTTRVENGIFLANSLQNGAESGQAGPQREMTRRNSDDNHVSKTKSQSKSSFLMCTKVKEIIRETLKAQLTNMEYSHRECGEKGRIISQLIEKSVKSFSGAMYKVTALVYIGAMRDQGIELACQCSWSPGIDLFAMETYRTQTLFASAIVFATIYE